MALSCNKQQATRTATATKTSNSLFISKVHYHGRELRPKVCLNVLKKNNEFCST